MKEFLNKNNINAVDDSKMVKPSFIANGFFKLLTKLIYSSAGANIQIFKK